MMPFFIDMSDEAKADFIQLENNPALAKRLKPFAKPWVCSNSIHAIPA